MCNALQLFYTGPQNRRRGPAADSSVSQVFALCLSLLTIIISNVMSGKLVTWRRMMPALFVVLLVRRFAPVSVFGLTFSRCRLLESGSVAPGAAEKEAFQAHPLFNPMLLSFADSAVRERSCATTQSETLQQAH